MIMCKCEFIDYELKDKWRMRKRIVEEEDLEQPELEMVQEQPLTIGISKKTTSTEWA